MLALVYGGYTAFAAMRGKTTETRYVLGTVTRGTVIASVSASGQVSSSDSIDIKPKAGGDIVWVGVKAGDTVYAGQALASIDATDAKQSIADAEQSLAQAKLQFQKDSAQAPIDFDKANEALDDAKKELTSTYNDTFNTLSDTYLNLPTVVTGLYNVLYGYDLSPSKSQWNVDVIINVVQVNDAGYETFNNFADTAKSDHSIARGKYDKGLINYKTLTRYSSGDDLEKILTESIDTTTAIAQALQSVLNLLDTAIDYANQHNTTVNSAITTMRTNAKSYLATTNSTLSSLLAQQKSLDASKKSIRDDERNLEILKIGNPTGENPISLQSSAYSISDQERSLQELKNNLANYTITAPFSGVITSLNIKRFDTVSTGTAAATVITNQKIASLSLNEVDAAKIKLGNKVTLTFDAVEDLTLTGEVVEMDAVGTVSQGVVSYAIKISFDTQDERIKPGMTVNASIITEARQDVLTVPASAIVTQSGMNYVQVFNPALQVTGGTQGVPSAVTPERIPVEIGLTDDTNTEILSGVSEGQQIVVRTIASGTAQTTTQSAPSLIGGGGVRSGTSISR